MALFNHAKREINAKIVYYGHDGVGKRTSLQYIYDRIKPSLRGDLKSPVANDDSLFFFDFSPFENPVIGDYRIRFHVYTLTGKVANPAAWKMTLKGADGVVIVADAAQDQLSDTREAISALQGFLAAYGVGLHDVPCILQLNKGLGSSHCTPDDGAALLDLPHIQACLFDAASGEGVLETLSLLSREIMKRIGQDDALQVIEAKATPETGDDAEVSAALLSLDMSADRPLEEKSSLSKIEQTGDGNQLCVRLAVEGIACSEGIISVPLEVMLGGLTRRLVVSVAIEPVSSDC
jgi:signal recognition particle receptor subunit beta